MADNHRDSDEENEEDVWKELEEDPEALRLQRETLTGMEKRERALKKLHEAGHGTYREIKEEDFIREITSSYLVVVHFYQKEFQRCRIVDKHFSILASTHVETKFVKINAVEAPFFVTKLKIKVLPLMLLFQEGKCVERWTGFDELGGTDDFSTTVLERKLTQLHMLHPATKKNSVKTSKVIVDLNVDNDDADDD